MAGMRILMVENHAEFARTVSELFLGDEEVLVVASVAGAEAMLRTKQFDALLVDYDLDDGKGTEVVRSARVAWPSIAIVAISAHQSGLAALLEAGADSVCGKMQFHTIRNVLTSILDSRT